MEKVKGRCLLETIAGDLEELQQKKLISESYYRMLDISDDEARKEVGALDDQIKAAKARYSECLKGLERKTEERRTALAVYHAGRKDPIVNYLARSQGR